MENKVIGVFAVCNTAGICVHEIDHAEDRVLASMNGIDPEWYPITEKPQSEMGGDSDELESGFKFASKFILQKISDNPSFNSVHQYTNQTVIQPVITHPEERIWAGQTPRRKPRVPDAPKIKHDKMKQFYMVDMGRKRW